ncbi:MAG: amylo-alpha-1,6-glucosidase [Rhodothermaceae bacterium]
MINKILVAIFCLFTIVNAQYLSNLNATKEDPIYTTYAAPLERSEYKIDQGYQMMWYDDEAGVNFISQNGGDIGLAFKMGNEIRYKLNQFYKEPVITVSYNDMVKFNYYPFENIKVEIFFDVYNSRIAIQDINIINETENSVAMEILPYFYHSTSTIENVKYLSDKNSFLFEHNKKRDGWMVNHKIPLAEKLHSVYMISDSDVEKGIYNSLKLEKDSFVKEIAEKELNSEMTSEKSKVLAFGKKLNLTAGEKKNIRIIRGMDDRKNDVNKLLSECFDLIDLNLENLVKENEKIFSRIPKIKFDDKDKEMLYWNAFSLIRQCMMPPEGECNYNYYVFSREPKWGWGYGGQVFHESLVMFAYAYMDPEGAMNSQRVYMERQWENGYINYRTGPYLNEQIEHEGQLTSSAPWYNYQNLLIYKITGDKKFLQEAYSSGKRFYNYYVSNRDSDNDGLTEWGAHAVLECVRDARVAVWDKVGWPSNFEAVDANAMLVSEANALSEMADILGYDDESEEWKEDAETRSELITKTFWDDESKFFYQVNKDDHSFTFKNKNDLKIKEIVGFLPMWAGVATKEQADDLVNKHLLNKDEFWRRFGIPTLSADHSYYNPIGYWNGPIWVQWQYLLCEGLVKYGYKNVADELTDKVLDNVIHQLKTDHWFWEFYSADEYQAGWNKAYIWTGIVAKMLIDQAETKN